MRLDAAVEWMNRTNACVQANFRRTNVATKLRITYLREQYLNVKIQYKACACPQLSLRIYVDRTN